MKSVNENYFKSSLENFQKSLPIHEIYVKYLEKNSAQVQFIAILLHLAHGQCKSSQVNVTNKCFIIDLQICWIARLLDRQIIRMLDHSIIRLLDCQIIRSLDHYIVRLLDHQIIRSLNCQMIRSLDCCYIIRQFDHQFVT